MAVPERHSIFSSPGRHTCRMLCVKSIILKIRCRILIFMLFKSSKFIFAWHLFTQEIKHCEQCWNLLVSLHRSILTFLLQRQPHQESGKYSSITLLYSYHKHVVKAILCYALHTLFHQVLSHCTYSSTVFLFGVPWFWNLFMLARVDAVYPV